MEAMESISQMIGTAEAAKLLGYQQTTLRRWRAEKKNLPAYKVGGRWRYNRSEVIDFRNAGRREVITCAAL